MNDLLIISNGWKATDDYVCYDLDHTLIKNKSGRVHPKSEDDIEKMYDNTFNEINKSNVVIFTNQKGLLNKSGLSKDEWLNRLRYVTNAINKKYIIFVAIGEDGYYEENGKYYLYRKPGVGMYKRFMLLNKGICSVSNIYVGDALGREGDYSSSDMDFGKNCEMSVKSPEEFFKCEIIKKNKIENVNIPNIVKGERELIIMVGSPASGKSTFVSEVYGDYKRVNQDILKTREKCVKYAKNYMLSGYNVVIDNTNPTKEVRKLYINMAKEYNYNVKIIIKESTRSQAMDLDNKRFMETGNRLSSVVFNVYSGKYEEPSMDEGEVIRVPFVKKI